MEEVPENEVFHIYYAYGICKSFTKIPERGEGKDKVNAELCGEPDLKNPKYQWIPPNARVYLNRSWV